LKEGLTVLTVQCSSWGVTYCPTETFAVLQWWADGEQHARSRFLLAYLLL